MQGASVEIRDVTGVLRWAGHPAAGDLDLHVPGVSGLVFVAVRASGFRWAFTAIL
jgi:hypothetical protein